MKMNELLTHTFKALRRQLGHDRSRDQPPMWQRRLSADSDFCRALVSCGFLTGEQMQRAAERYRLGRSRDGGVIFWQIDQMETVCDGKIMYYRQDCHRDHQRHPNWVSYLLKRSGQLPEEFKSEHCLFGLHLLAGDYTVAVVESEKTAVIMSELYPDYLWLASGGLYELTAQKLFPLHGRRIVLFPDTDTEGKTYATWYRVTVEARQLLGHPVYLSPLLEQQATKEQKAAKIDIVDFCFSKTTGLFI